MGVAGKPPVGQERVRVLYEEYIHLPRLKAVWDSPCTSNPVLEPCFAAAMHGVELCFLLLTNFIEDSREYVAKQPRIEAVALDIRQQCQLLSSLVDGELEEEGVPCSTSLTQDFPFEGCPPTITGRAHSPGLQRLTRAVGATLPELTNAERNSLVKVVLLITSAFASAFQLWTVGLGIEHQLNELLELLGLRPTIQERRTNLDYMGLARPAVCDSTFTCQDYVPEDFFFRTIHLGTECWMFIAINRVHSAMDFANQGQWHVASARIHQAARVLHYLGDHILMLTSMNLRDYLLLKVELEGTSGAGSSLVRAVKPAVLRLHRVLEEAVMAEVSPPSSCEGGSSCSDPEDGGAGQQPASGAGAGGERPGQAGYGPPTYMARLSNVYEFPDKYAGLYNYCKSLEAVETALLSGFYHKHYCLAANVIGHNARGTMRRAVAALKSSYEGQLFPDLDATRAQLGARVDAELVHLRGRMMDELMERYSSGLSKAATDAAVAQSGAAAVAPGKQPAMACEVSVSTTGGAKLRGGVSARAGGGSTCPFGFSA